MLINNFTSHTQKGFKANTPGCLEHSFAMFEALLDAKHNQREIIVTLQRLRIDQAQSSTVCFAFCTVSASLKLLRQNLC